MSKTTVVLVTSVAFSILGFFAGMHMPNDSENSISKISNVGNTLLCNELATLKKDRYFSHLGQYRVIYDEIRDSCLVLNIFYDGSLNDYTAMVLDTKNDEALLYFHLEQGEFIDEDNGWTREEMIQRVRDMGFVAAY